MKKHVKYRERLFAMLAELLLDPGPYKIKETALRYGVSDKQVRNDIDKTKYTKSKGVYYQISWEIRR
ncbi:hypothetical protein ADL26_20470 [Thermoactinomyces vulgaris]|nr:hypothetical protein ADL26_20470 [Thermoactinomyces vulgaris]